jgi:siroheme synthase
VSDAVVYDSLVNTVLLAHAPAERILVGKRKDRHSLPQARIDDLLVALALIFVGEVAAAGADARAAAGSVRLFDGATNLVG